MGFQSLDPLGRPTLDEALLAVPERERENGVEKGGLLPPMRALRKLQRVGVVTRTWGSEELELSGAGDGYGGCKLGEGMRGFADADGAEATGCVGSAGAADAEAATSEVAFFAMAVVGRLAVDGPACEAVGTRMPLGLELDVRTTDNDC